ncbi:phosphotransferase family protein, partial [Rothia nasimurium]|uniref:phosphotransferase family protein n=1 Tax=Rothia nasimurium TaxID=85336 RepID=UPI00361CE6EE
TLIFLPRVGPLSSWWVWGACLLLNKPLWLSRTVADVKQIHDFTSDVASMKLPFRTPEIEHVFESDKLIISIEERLEGTPLTDCLATGKTSDLDVAIDAIISILVSLRETSKPQNAHMLPMFDIKNPDSHMSGTELLRNLAQKRLDASPALLEIFPDAFDFLEPLEYWLSSLDGPEVLTHGDLCGENILLDKNGRVSAVLDWGFLTCYAPPAIDQGISTGILDMYSPHAQETDERFVSRLLTRIDNADYKDILRARALYALISATAYSAKGEDGHFMWCMNQFNRFEVREAVFSS